MVLFTMHLPKHGCASKRRTAVKPWHATECESIREYLPEQHVCLIRQPKKRLAKRFNQLHGSCWVEFHVCQATLTPTVKQLMLHRSTHCHEQQKHDLLDIKREDTRQCFPIKWRMKHITCLSNSQTINPSKLTAVDLLHADGGLVLEYD